MRAMVLVVVVGGLACAGCGTEPTSVESAGGSSTDTSSGQDSSVAEVCDRLLELRTERFETERMLTELRALEQQAPDEIRDDLQLVIHSGEDLLASGGTTNTVDPGPIAREGQGAMRRLNVWLSERC